MALIACGIECASVVSVQWNKHDVLVSLHDMLRAVSVMDVPIDNCHSILFPFLQDVICANRDTVVDAEAIDGVFGTWVMSWWSDDCKSILPLSFHEFIDSFQQTARCDPGCILWLFIEISVKDSDVGTVAWLWPEILAEVDVLLGVGHAEFVLEGESMDWGNVVDFEMGQNLLFFQDADDDLDSLWSFRMFASGFVVEHPWVVDDACFEQFHIY